jgi:hypothetical protein
MGVRARDRGQSEVEFLNTAHELEMFTIRAAHNENVIPKRYRLTLGKDLMTSVRTIHANIVYANSLNPLNVKDEEQRAHTYQLRYDRQKRAYIELQNLFAIMRVVSELLPVKDTVLEEWTGLVLKEEKVLKAWIASDKKRFS